MKIPPRPKVLLLHCDRYEAAHIRTLVRGAMEELDLRPRGRTLLKPNVVASGIQFPHAYTRPEVVEGVIGALRDRDTERRVTELAVGERCGITVPTRLAFQDAGYYEMFKRTGVKHYHFEEERQVEIPLSHPGRLRDFLFTPEPVARADFFVNCPKFKSHPWTTVTFSMKNYIGIQDDRHRLIDHDHRLDEKVRDLQFIVQPQLIVIDGIIAGEGRMLTPIPRRLELLVIGNAQLAIDAVCARIIGLDPRDVPHLRLAEESGFGSLDPDAVELGGDVSLDEARKRAHGFQVGLVRVEKYFEGTNITAYAGPPPQDEEGKAPHAGPTRAQHDYCWGGCPGAIEEAIEILRQFDEHCDAKLPRLHVVFGAYEGPIDAKPGERVVFIGDCASYEGTLPKPGGGEQLVQIKNQYMDRSTKDPHEAKHDDVYAKMASVSAKVAFSKKDGYLRMSGCPVSVAEQVLVLCSLSSVKNPILDPDNALRFNKAYVAWRGTTALKRLKGVSYQVAGATERGDAAPDVEATGAE